MVDNVQITTENKDQFDDIKSKFVKNKRFVKVAHINVENIKAHRESFINTFKDNIFDIIAVSETFLKPVIPSEPYMLNEYNLLRHDRESKEGGGLAVYIRKGFTYKIIAHSQAMYCRKPEFVIIEICMGWKLLLGVVYKPPKLGFISEFFDILGNLLPTYSNVLVLGDFNVNLASDRMFAEKVQFLNTVKAFNLNILPLQPTFHLPNICDSLLDLLITNDISRVRQFGQTPVSGISYHDLIFVELNLKIKLSSRSEKIFVRDFKNVNNDDLKSDISNVDWNSIYVSESMDEKVDIFNEKLSAIYDKHVPLRQISNKRDPCPWITGNIKSLMKERDLLYKQYVKTKNQNIWETYKVLRNRIKRIIRDSRNDYFAAYFQPNKSTKGMWKVIKDQGSGKSSKCQSDVVVDLNELNGYFCGINNNISDHLIDYYKSLKDGGDNVGFCFNDVSSENIHKVLFDISSNAVGNDDLHIKFIRMVFEEIKQVLCHIFNYSLNNCVYPKQWKQALILPLPKVTNPLECKHYRSINILCVFGKILDKLVYQQMCNYVNDHNILNLVQSGYRSHFSTQTALIKVTDDIRLAMDKRKVVILVLLDFSRAFDCVHPDLLLAILESYNFSSTTIRWFKSYLSNRQQRIKAGNGMFSDWKLNLLGVPQGSTLSALLFSLYINKINNVLMFCNSMLYADDKQIYISCNVSEINRAVEMINADLVQLFTWCTDHGLDLNVNKCKVIVLGTSRLLNNVNLDTINKVIVNGQTLTYESSVLNLGLRITNTLSWNEQVDYVHKRVYQSLYQFKRLVFKPPVHVKKQLVMSLIFPLFDYAIAAYCDINVTLIDKLQKAQNACIRYIYDLRLDDHVTRYYKDLNWLKVKERIELNVLNVCYKVLKYRKPEYLFKNYSYMSNVHLRETRFGDMILQVPLHRTVIYNNSFHVKSIRLMNLLTESVRQSVNDKSFSRKVKEILIQRYN